MSISAPTVDISVSLDGITEVGGGGSLTVATGDIVFIRDGIEIAAGAEAIDIDGNSRNHVIVEGSLVAGGYGISLDMAANPLDMATNAYEASVNIGATGSVFSIAYGLYIGSNGNSDRTGDIISVVDGGTVSSISSGAGMFLFSADQASVANSGTISSNDRGSTWTNGIYFLPSTMPASSTPARS